jgi:hypothetical protein
MNITQVASVAGAFEASRNAGVQQAGTAAASATVQRQAAKAASEADVRETETVKEAEERPNTSGANGRKLDITV